MKKVNKKMTIGQVLDVDHGLAEVLMNAGLHCLGCPSSQMETIEEAAMVHGFDVDELVTELNNYLSNAE